MDMDAQEFAFGTHINDLPPEMLRKIFSYLKKFSDRDRAVGVCSYWSSVINETIGLRKWIGNGSEFWDTTSDKWLPLMELHTSGISKCFFSDVMGNLGTVYDPENSGFIRPYLVGHVEIDGSITQDLFETIINPLQNLRVLALHLSTLSLIEINLNRSSLVQNLSELCLTTEGFHDYNFHDFEMSQVYLNLVKILDVHFPQLKSFHSSLPLFLDKEADLFIPFANFCIGHAKTIQEISVKITYRWNIKHRNSYRRTATELTEVFDGLERAGQLYKKIEPLLPHELQSLVFIVDDRRTIYPSSLGMKNAMFQQRKLRKLYYVCWDYIDLPATLISRNASTLKEIGLTVNDITNGPVNCTVFTECHSLTKLLLEADGEVEFDNIVTDAPRLQNPAALPKSLKSIEFRNIYIATESIEIIAKELPSLTSLYLTNMGKVEDLGMSLPCLLWILKESPTIRKLKVKGLNENSFSDYFSKDSVTQFWDEECLVQGDGPFATGEEEEDVQLEDPGYSDGDESILNLINNLDDSKLPGALSSEDQELLDDLMMETNMETKYVPNITKRKGIWKKQR